MLDFGGLWMPLLTEVSTSERTNNSSHHISSPFATHSLLDANKDNAIYTAKMLLSGDKAQEDTLRKDTKAPLHRYDGQPAFHTHPVLVLSWLETTLCISSKYATNV